MPFLSQDDQRKYIAQGERDVEEWKHWEKEGLADLRAKEEALSRNPTDPTLQKRRDDASTTYELRKQARERREAQLDAAKRAFGWA
jgi:hypothetical protein